MVALVGVAAAVAVAAVVVLQTDRADGDGGGRGTAGPDTFAAYADTVIDETPGAYRPTDDVLVLPPGSEAPPTEGSALPPARVDGKTVLPTHWFEAVEAWPADARRDSEVEGTVLVDRGPAVLACTRWPGSPGCTLSVGHTEGGRFVYGYGLGTDAFQEPGKGMEVFLVPTYSAEGEQTLVVAGAAADVSTASVETTDGEVVEATVADTSPSGPVYFATTTGTPARVIGYDDAGEVLIEHEVEPCRGGGAECEVR